MIRNFSAALNTRLVRRLRRWIRARSSCPRASGRSRYRHSSYWSRTRFRLVGSLPRHNPKPPWNKKSPQTYRDSQADMRCPHDK